MVENSASSYVASLHSRTEDSVLDEAEGNCGVIVSLDGTIKAFAKNFPEKPEDWTAEHHKAARIMTALVVASSNEQLMAILYDVMDNTEVMSLMTQ